MGMGEPMANYDRTWEALRTITDPDAFGLGARHVTVSTVGLPQGIRRMAGEPLQINLAVSLHAPNDALRSRLLPVNLRFPIREVMAAIRDYIAGDHRRVTFEYALMDRINDTAALARELVALLKPLRSPTGGAMCHVNLIPLNPVAGVALPAIHPGTCGCVPDAARAKRHPRRHCACAVGSTLTRGAGSSGAGWTAMER